MNNYFFILFSPYPLHPQCIKWRSITSFVFLISICHCTRMMNSGLNPPYSHLKANESFNAKRANRKICVAHGSGYFIFYEPRCSRIDFAEWYRLHGDRGCAACQDSHRISNVFYHRVRWRARASRISGPIFDYPRE